MPTTWVTGRLKTINGDVASPDTLASKVFLENGQTVDNELSSIDSTQSSLSTSLTNLRLAATSLANAITNSNGS